VIFTVVGRVRKAVACTFVLFGNSLEFRVKQGGELFENAVARAWLFDAGLHAVART
jgi:hypothetical protein